MSLTFQPFFDRLSLHKPASKINLNVSDGERLVCAFVGAAILVAGLARGGLLSKLPLLLTGGVLLKRAATGHCELYDVLHTDSRHTAQAIVRNLRG